MEENNLSVFKSYLRLLLHELKSLKEAMNEKNYDKVTEIVDKLIEDTQKGIEN